MKISNAQLNAMGEEKCKKMFSYPFDDLKKSFLPLIRSTKLAEKERAMRVTWPIFLILGVKPSTKTGITSVNFNLF